MAVGILALIIGAGFTPTIWPRKESPRAKAHDAALRLVCAFAVRDMAKVADLVRLPAFLAAKTSRERNELLSGILTEEISAEGLAELRSRGEFGPLRELFPAEATAWATAFSVHPEDCVAFKMHRDNIRAELVLLGRDERFVVLRCNNVKQMAPAIRL